MSITPQQLDDWLKGDTSQDVPPTPPEKDTSAWSAFQYAADQPLEAIGVTLELLGAEGVGKWLKDITEMPENYETATQAFINQQGNEFWFDFEWSYLPRMVMEQAGQLVGSLASKFAGAGIGGYITKTPHGAVVGAFLGPAMFEAIQILGQTVLERAARDDPPRGPDELTWEDWTAAAGTATVAGLLNAIGIKNLPGLNRGLKQFMQQTGKATVRELSTEAAQSITQELGSGVGTEKGLRPVEEFTREALAEGIAGGTAAGTVQGVISGAQLATERAEPLSLTNETWREDVEAEVQTEINTRLATLEKDTEDMGIPELVETINRLGYEIPRIPGETRESVYDKLKGFVEEDIRKESAFAQAKKNVLSVIDKDRILKEERAALDAMTDEEFRAWVEQEYGRTADRDELFDEVTLSQVKTNIAQENADRRIAIEQSDPIYILGKTEQEQYVKDISERYTLEELREMAKAYGVNPRTGQRLVDYEVDRQSKPALAKILTDSMVTLEIARQRLEKTGRNILRYSWDISQDEFGRDTAGTVKDQNDPMLHDLLKIHGNAISAQVAVMDRTINNPRSREREAKQRLFNFVRSGAIGLEEDASIEERIQRGNGQLVLAPDEDQTPAAVKWLEEKRQNNPESYATGIPLNQFANYWERYIADVEVAGGTLPHMNRGLSNKFFGFLHSQFRPYMPMGLIVSRRHREQIANMRSLDKKAERAAFNVDKALLAAFDKKEVESVEQAEKLFMAFLRKTGAQIPLDEDQVKAMQEQQRRLEEERFSPEVRGNNQEIAAIEEKLDALEAYLAGSQKTAVALAQLPESLKKTAVESRASIDALTNRLIEELPPGTLTEQEIAVLQAGINQYVTRSFALFEPALGWDPKTAKKWLRSSKAKKLYNEAVVAVEEMNKGKPNFTEQDARDYVDDVISGKFFKSAYDVAKLPGILRSNVSDDGITLAQAGKLLSPRWDIPLPLRKLMGEINDPRLVMATSMSRIAKLIEMAKFYTDLKRINDMPGEMLFSPKEIGDYRYQVQSNEFNPLSGYWTTKEVVQALGIQENSDADIKSTLIGVYDNFVLLPKGLSQFGIIVLSPATQMRNFAGAGIMFTAAGYLGKGGFPEAFDAIGHELGFLTSYDADGNLTVEGDKARKMYERSQELGVSNTNVRMNDALGVFSRVRDGQYQSVNELSHALYALKNDTWGTTAKGIKEAVAPETMTGKLVGGAMGAAIGAGLAGPIGAATGAAVGATGLGRLIRGAQATYTASDDFFKMAAWGADMIRIRQALDELDSKSNHPDGMSDAVKLRVLREYAETLTTKGGGERYRAALGKTKIAVPGTGETISMAELAPDTLRTEQIGYESNMAKALRNVTDLDTAIEEVAAYHVRQTIPNYDYVGRFAKVLRQFPLGNFIAFPTEIARTTGNIAQLTYKQGAFRLSDSLMQEAGLLPEDVLYKQEDGSEVMMRENIRPLKNSALRRAILGTGAIVGLPAAAVALGQTLFDVDDEELDATAEIGPDYARGNQKMPVSGIDENGEGGRFLDLDYYFPYTGLTKIQPIVINAIRRGEFEGQELPNSIVIGIRDWAIDFARSYSDVSIAPAVQLEIMQNRDKDTGRQIYNPSDNGGEIFEDILLHIYQNAGPGFGSQLSQLYLAFAEGDERYTRWGQDFSKMQAIAKIMGLSTMEVNPNRSFGFLIGEVQRDFRSLVEENMKEVRTSEAAITEEDILNEWEDAQNAWFEIQQNLYFAIQDYKMLKLSNKEYKKQMKRLTVIAGVDNLTIKNIEKGIFTPWKLPNTIRQGFDANKLKLQRKQRKAGLPVTDIKRTWPAEKLRIRYRELKKANLPLVGVSAFPGVPTQED
jgi:hypothetical protein